MLVLAVCITAVAAGAVIAATVLVSVASVREDARWTLGKTRAGWVERTGRRVVDFHSELTQMPLPKSRVERACGPRGQRWDELPSHRPASKPASAERQPLLHA
jgi:hypothetical protein